MAKCFLVEPVYHPTERVPEPYREWNDRVITHFIRPDTGETKEHAHLFGPGAMWYAVWLPKNWNWDNETEPHLEVICPNGRCWDIDSRCSNCALPDDRMHRCWVRHGSVPDITVDKNGLTCAAGGGSIVAGDFHGFLRNGEIA